MQIVKKIFESIDAAVGKVGAESGYHLILDGAPGANPGLSVILYYSPTIDMTQKVVDVLNATP